MVYSSYTLFQALAALGPMRLDQLANATNLVPRYVEEWANGMVSAGYLEYDPKTDLYALPEEHAYLLASDGTDHFMGGLFGMMPSLMAVAPKVLDAFREGSGVRFEEYPPLCHEAIDMMNRGNYEHRLVDYWLKQLPETIAKLESGGRALDVGCGSGQAVVALAKAFPASHITGVDPHSESISAANKAAALAGVESNAEFIASTLDQIPVNPRFDLIMACDCMHDLPDPVRVLGDARARLADDGVFFLIEPRVADKLEDNINPIAAMFYGFSVFHCMTQSLAVGGAGCGSCMGPEKTIDIVKQAGFKSIDMIDIKSPTNLFYVARC